MTIGKWGYFWGFMLEAILLAVSIGIFSIAFRKEFIYPFLNNPFSFSTDHVVGFYILISFGFIVLISYASLKMVLKVGKWE